LNYTVSTVQRTLAILLLTIFSLPYASIFFSSVRAEGGLPACCRKNGKHRCSMMMSDDAHWGESVHVVSEKCPYTPAIPPAFRLTHFSALVSESTFAEFVSHPAIHAQTHAKYRISSDRSRQKRGPPTLIFL